MKTERFLAVKKKIKLYQVFVPSVLKGLYDTDNKRLLALKKAAYSNTVEKLKKQTLR